MASNINLLRDAIVLIYNRKNGVLQKPIFGILTQYNNKYWIISVYHSIFDYSKNEYIGESLEIWSDIHPEVAAYFKKETNAELIAKFSLTNDLNLFITDNDNDLIAFPVNQNKYNSYKLDYNIDPVTIGDLAYIGFLDYADDNGVLKKYLDGITGNVSRISDYYAVISAQGSAGMSGSPVFKLKNDKFNLFGIYTGTPQTTPLTMKAVINFSKVTFLNDIFINKLK